MSEDIVRQTINNNTKLNLKKPKQKYLQFDAYDKNYIVEIKVRNTHYDKQIIEFSKYAFNSKYAKINDQIFVYAIAIKDIIYIFNISKLEKDYIFNWEWRKLPATTEFKNNDNMLKYVGYLNLADAITTIKIKE
tara:strand:- start:882 stop:1283 length:402 start_codon:yes stop_codon:yes gene_type:complete